MAEITCYYLQGITTELTSGQHKKVRLSWARPNGKRTRLQLRRSEFQSTFNLQNILFPIQMHIGKF